MWESIYPAAMFALGMVLTGTFLSFGLWAGYKVGKASVSGGRRNKRLGRRWTWIHRELARCATLAEKTKSDSQRLATLLASAAHSRSSEGANAARRLVEASTGLCDHLQ